MDALTLSKSGHLLGSPDGNEDDKNIHARPEIPQVVLRTITGLCNSTNRRAIDWSSNGLVAYASHGVIVIVDPHSLQQVQSLDEHRSSVCQVRWNRGPTFKHVADRMTLATSDMSGQIIVWNAMTGETKCKLNDGNRPVSELLWMDGKVGENNGHLLLALHLPSTLILWDTGSGNQIWKKTFSETIRGFDMDPFDDSRILLRCVDSILFIQDFSTTKCPSGNGKKFLVPGPSRGSPAKSESMESIQSLSIGDGDRTRAARSRIKKMMKEFVLGEVPSDTASPTSVDTLSECQQVLFHRSARSHLMLVYHREVLILDMDIGQTVGVITSNLSPIVNVWSASQRDAIFVLCDNGVISMRCRKRLYTVAYTPAVQDTDSTGQDVVFEILYEQKAVSETIRLCKSAKILGMAVHPSTEKNFAVFTTDGRVIFVEVMLNEGNEATKAFKVAASQRYRVPRPMYSLEDFMPSMFDTTEPASLKFHTRGIVSGLSQPPFVVRMCPPLTMKNLTTHAPLCAIGSGNGNIQIVNMATGIVEREFVLHTFPVRGIEWTGLRSILSHSHQNLSGNASQFVRNELMHTDLRTGKSTPLRANRSEEPPIQFIRVSHLKQYFIVAFHGAPFELWDLRNFHLLRTMPKKFPPLTAIEWSPLHNLKSLKKKLREEREKKIINSDASDSKETTDDIQLDDQNLSAKEHFVFTDPVGQLYHFSVEGNAIRDGTKLPAEASLGTITCISWKSDHIVRADADGNLNIWDVRTRTSRNINTNRGQIKKIRFAPGRGNMKLLVLHNDSVSIWDAKECEIINELRLSKDLVSKPLDIEWAASDRPVIFTADGCLRIMSLALTISTSSIFEYDRPEPIYCHALLPNKARKNFQIMLHHQPWREKDSLEFGEEDGFKSDEVELIKSQVNFLDDDIKSYLINDRVSTARKCFLASQVSGLQWETEFWRLVVALLEDDSSCFDISQDLAGDRGLYIRYELERLKLHEHKSSGHYTQRRKVIDLMLCLNLRDEAMRLLLETEPSNPSYYSDHLLACLVSSTSAETDSSHSTTKLVATNLIAEGKLWQGVQLLCLIKKVKEACQYLQSYGLWDASMWLAKFHFPNKNDEELMKISSKYCDYQFNRERKKQAILAHLAMQDYVTVLDKLLSSKMVVLAAQFLQVLKEKKEMPDTSHAFVLTEEINLAYARHLFDCGNRPAAFYYCEKADEKGEILQRELEMMMLNVNIN